MCMPCLPNICLQMIHTIFRHFRAIDLNTTVRVIQACDQAQLLLPATAQWFLPGVVLVDDSQQSHQVPLHRKIKSQKMIG